MNYSKIILLFFPYLSSHNFNIKKNLVLHGIVRGIKERIFIMKRNNIGRTCRIAALFVLLIVNQKYVWNVHKNWKIVNKKFF